MNHLERLISTLEILPSHWRIIPTNDKKIPLGYQWQKHFLSPQQMAVSLAQTGRVEVLDRHRKFYQIIPQGIGLLCGQTSKEFLVAIDADGASAHAKIQELSNGQEFPQTIAFTSGRPGRAQYLFCFPGTGHKLKSRKIFTADGETLELRGTGLQSLLPPSPHPITGCYQWLPGCSPEETETAIAPDWVRVQMTATAFTSKLVRNRLKKIAPPVTLVPVCEIPAQHLHKKLCYCWR